MSNSFTDQTLAQIELFTKPEEYPIGVYVLPSIWTRRSPVSTLDALGVRLTTLRPEQASYIGVKVEGPVQGGPLPLLISVTHHARTHRAPAPVSSARRGLAECRDHTNAPRPLLVPRHP